MGMFDYVRIPIKCKKCGKVNLGAQTKDTECEMKTFTLVNGFLHSVPLFDGYDEDDERPSAKNDYYSGHIDAYIQCCDEWTTNRFIFVRGQLVYQDVL